MERFFAATLINEPYDPAKIHVSHDLECVDAVGQCKVCFEAWVGEDMMPGLAAPCSGVKPKLDPGQPMEGDEGAAGMAAQIEERLEKRLGEMVYANGFPLTIRDVKEAVRYAHCTLCKGTGTIGQMYDPARCEAGGVKYCACPIGAERYEADRVSTTNIIAPITREWRFFPADQYGTPEFLRLCTDQAKEQRAAGRLAIAAALERYVESKR